MSVLSSIISSVAGSNAAGKAADAQKQAANKAIDLQKYIYEDSKSRQQPYYQAGLGGLGMAQMLMGNAPTSQNALAQPTGNGYQGSGSAPVYMGNGMYGSTAEGGRVMNALAPDSIGGVVAGKTSQPYGTPQIAATSGGTGTGGAATGYNTGMSPTDVLRSTPGYQFKMDEATRGLENSFAARGNLLSGASMNALQERLFGIADQTYQQTLNNQFNMANLGMGAAAQMQGAGSAYAANAGNAYQNIGNANANQYYGKANALNAGIQGINDSIATGIGVYGGGQGWF